MRSQHTIQHFTPHATLAALGLKLQALRLFAPIRQHVHIRQKSVKYSPVEKLYDAFISILAGAHGLSEVNTRLRSDSALQRAFGRLGCAEQSAVQRTLDACSEENVSQMQQALDALFRTHSRAFRHHYHARARHRWSAGWLMPCGSYYYRRRWSLFCAKVRTECPLSDSP